MKTLIRRIRDQIDAFALGLVVPAIALAATTGPEFQVFYDFVYNAATGYLGRGLAITGGLIGLGIAAATGKVVIAIIGVVLAVFGILGPQIINALFGGAVV